MAAVKEYKGGRKKRTWRTVKDPHAKCLLCGTSKPLAGAHIIPRKVLDYLPEVDRRAFYDQDGINVFRLCFNHHTLYDSGKLDLEEHLIMMGHAVRVVAELNRHVSKICVGRTAIPSRFFDEFDLFILQLPVYDKLSEN